MNTKEMEPFEDPYTKKNEEDNGKSLSDMLRDRRELNEGAAADKNNSGLESVEERRKRLKA